MLIALTGMTGSGKAFVAERIQATSNWPVEVRAFAEPIKESLCAFFGITLDQLESLKRSEDLTSVQVVVGESYPHLTWREIMERWGSSHTDTFGPTFWADMHEVWPQDHEGKIIIYDDLRGEAEAKVIHRAGGLIWEVVSPDAPYDDKHWTRQRLDPSLIAFQLTNDPSNPVEELDSTIGSLLAAHDSMASALAQMDTAGR